jgi:hypothetical protein
MTTQNELKKLEKQLELLREENDREIMKSSDAIKDMVAYMKETKEPFDGQGDANPYTTKPGGKGGCCSVA